MPESMQATLPGLLDLLSESILMKVPFVDLSVQYQNIKSEIDNAIASVMRESTFIGGRFVKEFEEQFAKEYGVKHVISCGNGTDSLYIIMRMHKPVRG